MWNKKDKIQITLLEVVIVILLQASYGNCPGSLISNVLRGILLCRCWG